MNGLSSQINKLSRDTLIHRAEGDALTWLSEIYGVPRPIDWDETSWRDALSAVAIGPRGVPGSVLAFLELAYQNLNVTIEVTTDPAAPTKITATAGGGTFTQDHVGRLLRIDSKLYYSKGPADVAATAGDHLFLAPIATPYWTRADFQSTETYDAEFLPFVIREPTPDEYHPADNYWACRVFITLLASLADQPSGYLREDYVWLLYDTETSPFEVGETLTGSNSGATAIIRQVIDNGTTGVLLIGPLTDDFQDGEIITDSATGSATTNGITGALLQQYDNETGGGFALGNTVTGATSGTSGTINGIQDNGTEGILVIDGIGAFTDGEDLEVASTKRGEADGATRALEPDDAQPEAGFLLPGVTDEGNQTSGPYPMYLFGSLGGVIVERLQILLASGFFAEAVGLQD
jgi:hypothetical protein